MSDDNHNNNDGEGSTWPSEDTEEHENQEPKAASWTLPPPPFSLPSAPPSNNHVPTSPLPPPPPPPPVRTSLIPPATSQQEESTRYPEPDSLEHLFHPATNTHANIIVIATESAHQMAWKNNLRITDLLQGILPQTTYCNVRTLNNKLCICTALPVLIMETMPTLSDTQAHELLTQQASLQTSDGNLEQDLQILEEQIDVLSSLEYSSQQAAKDAYQLTSPLHLPWLQRYQTALNRSVSNTLPPIEWPLLVVTICTTHEELSVAETLQALQSPHYLPAPFQQGWYNYSNTQYHAMVWHDNSLSSTTTNEDIRTKVLRLNSIPLETAQQLAKEESHDLWNGQGTRGMCLSVSDRVALRQHLATLVNETLARAIETRIANLHAIVSEKKKGVVRNVLKTFGWRSSTKKEEEENTVVDTAVPYRHDSIEAIVLQLAELLFLVQDYDNAYSMYRLVRDDFKTAQAHLYHGFVQERMARCLYQMDAYGRARDILSLVEGALLAYHRTTVDAPRSAEGVASAPTRWATRLCLTLSSWTDPCAGRHLEVADLLASASSNETPLGAAVLLEQASAQYYAAEMYRKYAFHMLMSGHMFRSASQSHHALRCFTSAMYIYREGRWEELHNHLRSALAAQLYSMGRMGLALQLYALLVGSSEGGKVSVKSQQKFVTHLLEVCNDHPKKALVGADRMVGANIVSLVERDRVRTERLDRIVQVVRYTKSASRVLELSEIHLPQIDDTTVNVLAEEISNDHHMTVNEVPGLGHLQRGDNDVWKELTMETIAELNALDESKPQNDDTTSRALAKIENMDIRRVIAQIDKEKANDIMLERTKRSASYKEKPPVRALREPITVEFTMGNPLGIPIDVNDLQVVAKMINDEHVLCTNEDAINIIPLRSYDRKESWTFQGKSMEYYIPHFCRVSAAGREAEKQAWKSAEEVEPFFVVTKSTILLEPESQRTVAVRICPLVQGDLEILGVRCRLLDDVWVFHPFRIKGPLLQNTRYNRAHRIRGEPVLLKAKIERGMPCLTVDWVPSEGNASELGPVLQGQVRPWKLCLKNVGTANATNVYLKTNIPWVSLQTQAQNSTIDAMALERQALSSCVGPTGTLMKLPIEGSQLANKDQLQPGESIEIPILVRSSGAGKQAFYLLFRYELVHDGSGTRRKERWLRKMFEVPVYPSLTMTASLMPSYSSNPDHILSIELTNLRSDRPANLHLILDKLVLASRRYRLEPLPGQLYSKITDSKIHAKIDWQNRLTMHYRVYSVENPENVCYLSECSFNDDSFQLMEASFSPLMTYMCLERTREEFEVTYMSHRRTLARAMAAQGHDDSQPLSIAQIRRANTSTMSEASESVIEEDEMSKPHATSLVGLCSLDKNTEKIHLVCTWRNVDGSITGQHHIRGLTVRPSTETRGCPITIAADYPSCLMHDFKNGPLVVPFEVTLRNRLVDASVDFFYLMEQKSYISYSGFKTFKRCLKGGEELKVFYEATLPYAGIFDLQTIRLSISHEDADVSYLFPQQWLVDARQQ